MVSTSAVVLHAGHAVTLVEYLVRVLVVLLAVTGLGGTVHLGLRGLDVVRSTNGERERRPDSES